MTLPALVNPDAVIGLVRERLLSVAEVVALVGGRIVGVNSDDPDYGTMPKPAIALEVAAGGRSDYTGSVARVAIRVGALSTESASDARSIFYVVRQALQGERLSSDADAHRGLAVQRSGVGTDGWFEAGQCWTVTGVWDVTVVRDRP